MTSKHEGIATWCCDFLFPLEVEVMNFSCTCVELGLFSISRSERGPVPAMYAAGYKYFISVRQMKLQPSSVQQRKEYTG